MTAASQYDALGHISAALTAWLAMLILASALASASLLVAAFAGRMLNRSRARERRRRLHGPSWVGRDERPCPRLWRVGDCIVPICSGRALSWGKVGPATERLAEIILRELVSANDANRLAAPFAAQVLAQLPPAGFVLAESDVGAWLARGFRPLRLAWTRVVCRGCTLIDLDLARLGVLSKRRWRNWSRKPDLMRRPSSRIDEAHSGVARRYGATR